MGEVITIAVPIALAAALGVVPVVLVIVLLATHRPIVHSGVFLFGYLLAYFVLGAFLLYWSVDLKPDREATSLGGWLKIFIGFLLVLFAVKRFIKQADPDKAPPKWMNSIREATDARRIFIYGFALAIVNVMNLAIFIAALHVVFLKQDEFDFVENAISLTLIVIAMCVTLMIPIGIYLVVPNKEAVLEWVRGWLDMHGQTVTIGVLAFLGVLLILNGVLVLV
jgi:hypothetical protein